MRVQQHSQQRRQTLLLVCDTWNQCHCFIVLLHASISEKNTYGRPTLCQAFHLPLGMQKYEAYNLARETEIRQMVIKITKLLQLC